MKVVVTSVLIVTGTAPPAADAMIAGVNILRQADLFNLVCIPDAVRAQEANPDAPFYSNYSDIYEAAKKLCEDKRAFLLVDTPPNVQDVNQEQRRQENQRLQRNRPRS